jgi:hypothetical protein
MLSISNYSPSRAALSIATSRILDFILEATLDLYTFTDLYSFCTHSFFSTLPACNTIFSYNTRKYAFSKLSLLLSNSTCSHFNSLFALLSILFYSAAFFNCVSKSCIRLAILVLSVTVYCNLLWYNFSIVSNYWLTELLTWAIPFDR